MSIVVNKITSRDNGEIQHSIFIHNQGGYYSSQIDNIIYDLAYSLIDEDSSVNGYSEDFQLFTKEVELEFKLKNLDKKAFAIDIYSINGQKSESPYGVYSCNNSIEINKELIRVLSEGPDKDGLFKVYVKGNLHMRFKPLERRKK